MKKFYLILASFLITFSTFAQDYTQLFLVGPATAAGWNANVAVAMTLVPGSDAVFTWTGQLNTGDFKFVNVRGNWTGFSTTASTTPVAGQSYPLLYNPSSDFKFNNPIAGLYTIVVNMRQLTMSFDLAVLNLPTDIWAVGTAVPNGKVKIINNPNGVPNQFKYIGALTAGGTLKFTSTEVEGAETKYFVPVTENIEIVGSTITKLESTSLSAGWSVATSSPNYKISINLFENTCSAVIFQPWANIYMVGGASAAGWDPARAIPFVVDTQNPFLFTFDGNLSIATDGNDRHKFKILGQQTGWGPNSLHAVTVDKPIIGSTKLVPNFGDNKWIVTSDKQGRYIITVDLLNETINAQYIDVSTSLTDMQAENYFSVISHNGLVEINVKNEKIAQVELFDFMGKKIDAAHSPGKISLGNQLLSGVYILKLNVDNKQLTRKIIVQ